MSTNQKSRNIKKKKSKKSGEFIIALILKILAHYDTYIQKNHFRFFSLHFLNIHKTMNWYHIYYFLSVISLVSARYKPRSSSKTKPKSSTGQKDEGSVQNFMPQHPMIESHAGLTHFIGGGLGNFFGFFYKKIIDFFLRLSVLDFNLILFF